MLWLWFIRVWHEVNKNYFHLGPKQNGEKEPISLNIRTSKSYVIIKARLLPFVVLLYSRRQLASKPRLNSDPAWRLSVGNWCAGCRRSMCTCDIRPGKKPWFATDQFYSIQLVEYMPILGLATTTLMERTCLCIFGQKCSFGQNHCLRSTLSLGSKRINWVCPW